MSTETSRTSQAEVHVFMSRHIRKAPVIGDGVRGSVMDFNLSALGSVSWPKPLVVLPYAKIKEHFIYTATKKEFVCGTVFPFPHPIPCSSAAVPCAELTGQGRAV